MCHANIFEPQMCPIFKNIQLPLKPIGELTQPMPFSTFLGSLLFHVHTAKQQSLIDLTCHEQHKHISRLLCTHHHCLFMLYALGFVLVALSLFP
jgi:hypothetical protein